MKLWKKGAVLLLAAVLLLPMWGCGYRELYERLLIQGIGVDADGEEFVVTVRSSLSSGEKEELFQVRGASVLEALESLTLSTGRKPFYGHNYLAVFGRECAQLGLDRCLDFFVRYHNTRPSVQMYLAEGTAGEILGTQEDGTYRKMADLQQLSREGQEAGKAVDAEILDFVNGVKREGGSPVVPVLGLRDDAVELVGSAYFSGYRLENMLTPEQTMGYLAAKGLLEGGQAVVGDGDSGVATLSISKASRNVEVRLRDGLPQFHLRLSLEADLSALSGGRNRLEEGVYQVLEENLSAAVEGKIRSVLDQALKEDRCDVLGLGNLLYQTFPGYWREEGKNWKELLAQCETSLEVTAKVPRVEQEALNSRDP